MEGEKHVIEKLDPNYPRAMYKTVRKGGDVISPAFPRIAVNDMGQSEKLIDRSHYITILVKDLEAEKKAIENGFTREVPAPKE